MKGEVVSFPLPVRVPAEWEPHRGTLLAWPHNEEDWPGKFGPIPWVFAEIVRHIAPVEEVFLLVQDQDHEDGARGILQRAHAQLDSVTFIHASNDRGWMRDCAPAFAASSGRVSAVQFGFNGWAKYDNFQRDAALPPLLAAHLKMQSIPAEYQGRPVILEGGGIDINGRGTLITTEECLLDPATQVRNPGFTKADYEAAFRQNLGITNVLWLGAGIAGDDTHGHVDDLCRFVNANTVVLCQEEDPADENYEPLKENWERLQEARLENGATLNVLPLPMPRPLYFEDTRLPASYANFYLCNDRVLVPTFNDPNDRQALRILAACFPEREVIGIHALDLVWGFGTLHCLTHEVPAE